jgi:uridine kinase
MYIIGITGGSGSGKTTFTEKVLAQVGTVKKWEFYTKILIIFPVPPEDLKIGDEPNFDHPEAFDWELFRKDLKIIFVQGKKVRLPGL